LQIVFFLFFSSFLFSDSYKSEFYYDSVLSCDEVRKRKSQVKTELMRERRVFPSGELALPFIAWKSVDYFKMERRLKNLELLETEKCYLNFK
jgi:predicted nucleic acid-binding protein